MPTRIVKGGGGGGGGRGREGSKVHKCLYKFTQLVSTEPSAGLKPLGGE